MPMFRAFPLRQFLAAPRSPVYQRSTASSYSQQRRTYAHEGGSYGGGQGDPKGERPQDQGSNPSAELEHPGPPPPDVGKGTGGGPTKARVTGKNTQHNDSSKGSSQDQSGQKSVSGNQPKILGENDPKYSEEVKAHNEDMKKRHDRPEEGVKDGAKDNVDKSFWSGKSYVKSQ